VRGLTKRFGQIDALKDLSFEVRAGEIFAFLGPNGAGKTTTINILTALSPATSGTVEVDGLDPKRSSHAVRQRFGIVFQDPTLDTDLTAYENMDLHGVLYRVPGKLRRARIQMLLQAFGLWDRRDSLIKVFSGGMRRRLEIARALLHEPKILFLDEPSLGLDAQSRNQLWAQVRRLNQEEHVTVFLTTHYLEEADRVASRIAVIDQGKIVATGSPQQLKEFTGKPSLEEAFLQLTGAGVRDADADGFDQLRQLVQMTRKK
jgi:ABC-2 type transport system ATP-binding protein